MWGSIATFFTSPSLFVLLNIVIGTIVLTSRLSSPRKPHAHQLGSNSVPPLARAPSLLDRVKSIDFSLYKFVPSNTRPEFYQPDPPQLVRAPSLLDKVKSINFSLHKFSPADYLEADAVSAPAHEPDYPPAQPETSQLYRSPSLLERVKSIDFTSFYRSDSGKVNPETEHPGSRESDSAQVKRSESETKETRRKVNKEEMKKSASEISRQEEEEGQEEMERRRPATMRAEKKKAFGETGDVDKKADDFINRFKHQLRLQRLDSLLRYKEMLNTTK